MFFPPFFQGWWLSSTRVCWGMPGILWRMIVIQFAQHNSSQFWFPCGKRFRAVMLTWPGVTMTSQSWKTILQNMSFKHRFPAGHLGEGCPELRGSFHQWRQGFGSKHSSPDCRFLWEDWGQIGELAGKASSWLGAVVDFLAHQVVKVFYLWQHLDNLRLKSRSPNWMSFYSMFSFGAAPGRQQTMTRPWTVAGKRKKLSNSVHFAASNFSIGARLLQFTRSLFWGRFWWSLLVRIGFTQCIYFLVRMWCFILQKTIGWLFAKVWRQFS